MSSRYSPSSPRALTEADIHSIPPSEIQATCDQLDQGTIVILQQIDENFAKANQVLNERILPGVQRHGENSQQIWESVKVSPKEVVNSFGLTRIEMGVKGHDANMIRVRCCSVLAVLLRKCSEHETQRARLRRTFVCRRDGARDHCRRRRGSKSGRTGR